MFAEMMIGMASRLGQPLRAFLNPGADLQQFPGPVTGDADANKEPEKVEHQIREQLEEGEAL